MRIVFAIPGDLSALTGGYGFDRRILAALPGRGMEVVHCALPGSFPMPDAADVAAAVTAINAMLRPGDVVLADGLAYGAMPEPAIHAIRAPIVELCHHPLGLESGLKPEQAEAFLASERRALAFAAHVVTPSASTRDTLIADLGVPAAKISIATPGTDPAARAKGSGGAPALLAIGSIIPRKAFDLLVEALAGLDDLEWSLRLAGSQKRAPETAAALHELITHRGLQSRIALLGELSAADLDRAYDRSDIFVSSSLYEGYGMVLAEAMARGLPVVTTTGGAAADTVPDGAGLKVGPGDAGALREALRRLIADDELRGRLADGAWSAGQNLPRWDDAAEVIAAAARKVSGHPT